MKKKIAMLLAISSVLTLSGCGKKKEPQTFYSEPEPTVMTTEAPTTAPTTVPTTAAATEAVTETTEGFTFETMPLYILPEDFTLLTNSETVYATRDVNIRTKPQVRSESPGKLKRGQAVQRVGSNNEWSAVLIGADVRFISSQYLTTQAPSTPSQGGTITETAASGEVYTTESVRFRKGPGQDTDILSQLPGGARLQKLAVCSNGWIKVSYNGQTGYVAGGYLTDKAPAPEPKPTVPDKTEPAETTENTKETTKPSDNKETGETTKPSDNKETGETTKPSDSQVPNETSKPSDSKVPNETSKPSDSKDPNETSKPSDSKVPNETSKPSDSKDPNESSKPSDNKAPSEGSQPADPAPDKSDKKD